MVLNDRPLKRMKRRVTADLHDFFAFPASDAPSSPPPLPFRRNLREFLSKHALPPPPSSLFQHLMVSQVLFKAGDLVACLDVIEEDVTRSPSVYCDQCRVVGWSEHPVCRKRYHFIIKSDGIGDPNVFGAGAGVGIGGAYYKRCVCGGEFIHLSDPRRVMSESNLIKCKSCNRIMTENDIEEWMYHQLEDTANTHHLLHGVVHANGFGHLLRVNGKEGGSRVLSGCQIMDFWDRLCKNLGVRKISVMDVSKKFGLDYRLLHAVIKGHPWYGNWGYEFGAGSFGVTRDVYAAAIDTLSRVPLSTLMDSGEKCLQDTIAFYRSLSQDNELLNIRDLFSFLLRLIEKTRRISSSPTYGAAPDMHNAVPDCTYSHRLDKGNVERVESAMMKVLRAVPGSNWVCCRALKAVAWKWGSPNVIEFCLKELSGKSASGGMVVVARKNSCSGAPEYRLEPGSVTGRNDSHVLKCPSVDILLWDLRYLYDAVLHPGKRASNDGQHAAAQRVIDCKKFIKDYESQKFPTAATSLHSEIAVSCRVELADCTDPADPALLPPSPPSEMIILPCDATLSDLKLETSRSFQELYLMFHRFQAEELIGYSNLEDTTPVKLLLPGGSLEPEIVRIRGRCTGGTGLGWYKMEKGDENWTVACKCGAKDDDGERMLACDVCSVWHHTRCSGIPDSESVPARFVCSRCGSPKAPHHCLVVQEMDIAPSPVNLH